MTGTWQAIWETTTGRLVSVGDVVTDPLPAGLSTTVIGPSPPVGIWNVLTHTFDPAPVLKSVLILREFWQRFTQVERETLVNIQLTGTQNQKNKLTAFKDYLRDAGVADLNDAYIQAIVNLMETAGIIAVGRAAVILA